MKYSLARVIVTVLLVAASSSALSAPASAAGLGPATNVKRITATTVQVPNWAGYAVGGSRGDFTSVGATWTQPSVTCGANETSYSSFWVGLDGYNSHSVEQIGTDSDCVNGSPTYYAWYEMYPKFPVLLGTISSGSSITASVSFANGTFTLSITGFGPVAQVSKGAARSSAEVIVEAPSSGHGPFSTLPLADFSSVSFSGATVDGDTLEAAGPDEIVMQVGTTTKADPQGSLSGGSFTVTWFHA